MRLKLNLAIALSHGADLLLLDEPTSGLDPMARDEFLGILRDYLAEGSRGVIFSTHITSDLEKIADFVTFIRSGKLVFSMDRESMAESFSLLRGGGSLPAGAWPATARRPWRLWAPAAPSSGRASSKSCSTMGRSEACGPFSD
jgi:hypothetical protein